MYRCAKARGRVIEKAEDGFVRCVLFFSLIFFSVTSSNAIRLHLTVPEKGLSQTVSAGAYSKISYGGETGPSGRDMTGLNVTGRSGRLVLTMDEDWGSSDSFWRKIKSKKKRKSRHQPAAVKRKTRRALINETPRSGLLTTRPGGSLFGIFSNSRPVVLPPRPGAIAGNVGRAGSGYRTLCVRLSDGYYWPISFSTKRKQFLKDRHVCKRSCAERVRLFVYPNPGGRPEDMVDLRGRPYSALPNAWRYREEYSRDLKCSPHPWEEASLAKHRAYAMMAKRRGEGARYITTAGLLKHRRLKRVGRARAMATIDLDFVEIKRSCAERVRLFVYPNPGGRPEDMVDLRGRPYSALPNAWRYREEYSRDLKCSPHPWEEASLAKHRAYAMMAKRRGEGARYITTAGLLKHRRLKRVGRARTMATIDLDFVENSRFRRVGAGNRGVGRGQYGRGRGAMALGAAIAAPGKKLTSRRAKPSRYRRKTRKSQDWVREAFGFD